MSDIDEALLGLSLRALVEQLPFDVWIRNASDEMVFANAALRRRWPGVAGRTVGKADVSQTVADSWRANNARALAGETVRTEAEFVIESERRTLVTVVAPIHGEAGIVGTVGINVDVSAERRAVAEAQRLGHLLREVFTGASVAIAIRAIRDDDIVYVEDNPRAAALLGVTPDELRGKTERQLGVTPERTLATIQRFRRARASGGSAGIELEYPQSSGGLRVLVGNVIALEDAEEERYLLVAEDVTELRSLQASLVHADRLASLGTLSASIGHEIANTTTVALGRVELSLKLAESGAHRDTLVASLRDAQQALVRTTVVLQDMRRLALGVEATERSREAADVDAAVEEVKVLLRELLERHATLRETRASGLRVGMSHSQLVQILLNVLRNALEAIAPRRGNVWLEISRPALDRVRIDLCDDGPGLDPKVRTRLFEPFASTKSTGSGLGLYVCRLLAQRAGGNIDAHGREGGGTRIRLELPVAIS